MGKASCQCGPLDSKLPEGVTCTTGLASRAFLWTLGVCVRECGCSPSSCQEGMGMPPGGTSNMMKGQPIPLSHLSGDYRGSLRRGEAKQSINT